jgi:hypothetical protein
MYVNEKPAIQDGLTADTELLCCSECEAYYRVHFSAGDGERTPNLILE